MRAPPFPVMILLAIVACAPPATHGAPAGAPAAAAVPAVDSLRGPWRLRNIDRPQRATLEMRAELRSAIDTLVRVDSIASQAQLEWTPVPGSAPPRLVGMLRSFAVRVPGDSAWRVLPDIAFPLTFAAQVAAPGTQPQLETPAGGLCDARAAMVQTFREAWISPPADLALGSTWEDSAAYEFCRDGIVLRTSARRRYSVAGADIRDGHLVLRVRRTSDAELRGRGVQFGDSVQVTGHGTGEGDLWLSLDGAAITSGVLRSELHLEMRGRRRTQQLVQTGVLEIRAP